MHQGAAEVVVDGQGCRSRRPCDDPASKTAQHYKEHHSPYNSGKRQESFHMCLSLTFSGSAFRYRVIGQGLRTWDVELGDTLGCLGVCVKRNWFHCQSSLEMS